LPDWERHQSYGIPDDAWSFDDFQQRNLEHIIPGWLFVWCEHTILENLWCNEICHKFTYHEPGDEDNS
jgi:hypothetical protein